MLLGMGMTGRAVEPLVHSPVCAELVREYHR